MPTEHLTTGEFVRAIDALKEDMLRPGFSGVHTRLDTLNGQTRKNSEAIARNEVRLTALENRPALEQRAGGALVPAGMSNRAVAGWGTLGVSLSAVAGILLQWLAMHLPVWLGLVKP